MADAEQSPSGPDEPLSCGAANSVEAVPPLVQLTDVKRVYKSGQKEVAALNGVSLTLEAGEIVALLGKSGSGKSTLLNLLAGLDRATEGSVRFQGRDLTRLESDELASYRRDSVSLVFQAFNLLLDKTAIENVAMPLLLAGHTPSVRHKRASDALAGVGLEKRLDHIPVDLSGGEQQRVAVARALITEPALLLADEPTGNLDSQTALEVMECLVADVQRRSMALVVVTHDEELATRYATRILRLRDGVFCDE